MNFTNVTKDFILQHVSEEEIFEFFGLPVVTYKFSNPYRVDRHPTCQFYRAVGNTKLRMHDWTEWFHGDCFDWVMFYRNENYSQALHSIANAFKLLDVDEESIERVPVPTVHIEAKLCELKVKRRGWLDIDRRFWGRWDFTRDTLNTFHVRPIQNAWLNDNQIYHYWGNNNIAYVYWFGGLDYKLYFPHESKGRRFLHSNPNILQGYDMLPATGNVLVITKSLKDVMLLYQFGIPAIAPMSEAQIILPEMYLLLKTRFDNIYSFYDYDYIGIKSMQKMKRMYGIQPLYLKPPQPKDFTDFYEAYGENETQLLIQTVKDNLL